MKKQIKHNNRKGFTLVETLLAAFILAVISTMLVNGFITTLGFSYQTSIYSKSGANNYALCMDKVANWSTLDNTGDNGREMQGMNSISGNRANANVLSFNTVGWPATFESLYVNIEQQKTLSPTVPGSLPYGSEAYAPNHDDLADNRKSFVYFPEYWQKEDDNNTQGKVVVMYIQSSDSYYWVVQSESGYASPTYVSPNPIGG